MTLPKNKTKLVCTIGPASESPVILQKMICAGMNIARLNFSHGDFSWHKQVIENIHRAAQKVNRHVTIMADLPGPKIRIGQLTNESITLKQNETFTLTTDEISGNQNICSVDFKNLPSVVSSGDILSLNDGIIQLKVVNIDGNDIICHVLVGGELRSKKGLNFPGINLGICAFTDHDRKCMKFALENGVDAISQSFVETANDINAVRQVAALMGFQPFIIAKIERAGALAHIDEILNAADGIMVARGDLGVETPLERIAIEQKQLITKANLLGKPVITATQMLESMVEHYRPTRAESTDVANAILDGTDCVMLSEESAMGKFPVEAVETLARIATATEPHRNSISIASDNNKDRLVDLISRNVEQAVSSLTPAAVIIPTATGHTARMISRFKLPVWIAAISATDTTCQGLQFSYGVYPICETKEPRNWNTFSKRWIQKEELHGNLVILAEGPSLLSPQKNPSLKIININQ